jgi:hypothetical protein
MARVVDQVSTEDLCFLSNSYIEILVIWSISVESQCFMRRHCWCAGNAGRFNSKLNSNEKHLAQWTQNENDFCFHKTHWKNLQFFWIHASIFLAMFREIYARISYKVPLGSLSGQLCIINNITPNISLSISQKFMMKFAVHHALPVGNVKVSSTAGCVVSFCSLQGLFYDPVSS